MSVSTEITRAMSRDESIARKLGALKLDNINLKRRNDDLERENRELHRELKVTRQFVPVQSHRSLEVALGRNEEW